MLLVGSKVIKIEYLWETSALFIFVFKPVFMSILLIKILLLYLEVFPTVKFKLLGIMDSNSFFIVRRILSNHLENSNSTLSSGI